MKGAPVTVLAYTGVAVLVLLTGLDVDWWLRMALLLPCALVGIGASHALGVWVRES
jgi:hypothetical protein